MMLQEKLFDKVARAIGLDIRETQNRQGIK